MKKISKKGDSFEIIRLVVLLSVLGIAVLFAFKIFSLFRFDWSFLAERFSKKEEKERVLPAGAEEFPFTDLFSGIGRIDIDKTTAWHDRKTMSLMLPPKYEWRELTEIQNFRAVDFIKFLSGSEWALKGDKGRVLVLDSEMKVREGALSEIQAGDSLRLAGSVQRIENDQFGREQYRGSIHEVEGGEIISHYPGEFSFGGTWDNWLAVYGGYEAKALRGSGDRVIEDYSKFFTIRVMEEKGFKPKVVLKDNVWYIGAEDMPKFLKIENEVANDLTIDLGLNNFEYNLFAPGAGDKEILAAAVDKGGTRIFFFRNLGFDQSSDRTIYSSEISKISGQKRIFSAVISSVKGNTGAGLIDFYLSADGGQKWQKAEIGTTVYFAEGRELKWKAILRKQRDAVKTPSLSQIEMKYYIAPEDS